MSWLDGEPLRLDPARAALDQRSHRRDPDQGTQDDQGEATAILETLVQHAPKGRSPRSLPPIEAQHVDAGNRPHLHSEQISSGSLIEDYPCDGDV